MSLVDIHAQLTSQDEVLEKEAAQEFSKLAEEDAAGRIMARGFMDELHKIAQGVQPITPGRTVPTGRYRTGPGPGQAPGLKPRKPKTPKLPTNITMARQPFHSRKPPRDVKPPAVPARTRY